MEEILFFLYNIQKTTTRNIIIFALKWYAANKFHPTCKHTQTTTLSRTKQASVSQERNSSAVSWLSGIRVSLLHSSVHSSRMREIKFEKVERIFVLFSYNPCGECHVTFISWALLSGSTLWALKVLKSLKFSVKCDAFRILSDSNLLRLVFCMYVKLYP